MLVRLQKFLADAGVDSRRRCEELIRQGQISVNGSVVTTLGTKVDPATDRVQVGAKPVSLQRHVYIAINKPAGVLCTSHDTHGRQRVLDLLPAELPRLFTVGRLDMGTEGLLFLTNDGTFGLRLAHPRYKMPKTYLVEVTGRLTDDEIVRLLKGVESDGEMLHAEKIFEVRPGERSTSLRVVLGEGKKRQIRRMMDAVGHPVRRLVRLAIGPFQLGNLRTGQWRYLSNEEVKQLMHN